MNIINSTAFQGSIHTRKLFGVAKISTKQDAAFLDCFSKAIKSPRMQREYGVNVESNVLKLGNNLVVTIEKSGKFSLVPFKMVTIQLIDHDGKEQFKWEIPKAFGLRSAFNELHEAMQLKDFATFKFDFSSPAVPGSRSPTSNFYEQLETMYTGKPTAKELGLN